MINQELSFEKDDILDRESIVVDITRYIELLQRSNTDKAISIAINSKWGSGKTFFLNMWKTLLKEEETRVIMYDAWENDDCGSALLPILYSIVSITKNEEETEFLQYAKCFLRTVFFETTKLGVKKLFGDESAITEVLENGVEALKEAEINTIFNQFDNYYGERRLLEDTLRQMATLSKGKLWVFIDDLDRCNPEFAINTLECVKHFFNIENVVYVFGVDIDQLQKIVTNVYGPRIDANSYLKRFFDCIYDLPDPNTELYIKYKLEKMALNDELKNKISIKDISRMSRHFKCSLRDLNQILIHLEVFLCDNETLLIKCNDLRKALKVYIYFMIVKDKDSVEYGRIIHGDYSVESNQDSHRELIDRLFMTADDLISELLVDISEGQAIKVCNDIFQKYSLLSSDKKTFKNHMQLFLK